MRFISGPPRVSITEKSHIAHGSEYGGTVNLENLERWDNIVGETNLVARPFASQYLTNGDIVEKLLSLTACKPIGMDLESKAWNESLRIKAINVSRSYTRWHEKKPHQLQSSLRDYFGKQRVGERITLMTEEIYRYLRERYADKNQIIDERFFAPHESDRLAFDDVYTPPGEPYNQLKT